MPRWTLILMLALLGCDTGEVNVRMAIPGMDSVDTPTAGIKLIALPYNRDSIISALEARAPRPRPDTRVLDSLFDAFRRPFVDYARAVDRVEKLKDTLTAIKRKLDSLPRGSGEYRDLYLRFGDRAESLAAVQRNEAQARDALDRTRRALGKRMDSLRAGVSRWEDTTFRGYDSIVTQLQRIRGRSAIQDSTRADGRTRLFLKGGPWWIYARSWDVMDPNREWYWNIPVEGDSVILDRRSGRHRTRY